MKLELMWKRGSYKKPNRNVKDSDGWFDLWFNFNKKDITDINGAELSKSSTNKRLWKYYV